MWTISKQFDFCYGHRVWSQKLNKEFALDSCLACRHLHGHQGTLLISLISDQLEDGMVTDFKHLNWFKKWLDDTLDHKFIMDINDPLLKHEVPLLFEGVSRVTPDFFMLEKLSTHWLLKYSSYNEEPEAVREKYEGMIFVNFVPTSENLAKWIFDLVQERMNHLQVKVKSVQFFETPKSQSIFSI